MTADRPQKCGGLIALWGVEMWKLIGEVLTSKKAIATIAGVLIVASNRIGLQLPEEAITQIIGAIAAYVVSQGLADFGKAAK